MKKIVLSLVMLLAVAALSAQNTRGKNNVKESVDEPTFIAVEQMPEFPGGQEGLVNYLVENLNYPEKAKAKKITGKVYVSFVVERDGSISNVKVLRDIGYGCGEEAVRVVKAMPHWKPGMQRGKNVRVQYTLPLNFQI